MTKLNNLNETVQKTSNELNIPTFPENSVGLKRGTILRSTHEGTRSLGIDVGDMIPVGYDGTYIRCMGFTWSLDQLIKEMNEWGAWEIAGYVDLSDPERSRKFAREIEQLDV